MSLNWYAIEQDVRQRHADELRRAANDRLVREVERAARARRQLEPSRTFLDRLGERLFAWGSSLRARGAGPAPERPLMLPAAATVPLAATRRDASALFAPTQRDVVGTESAWSRPAAWAGRHISYVRRAVGHAPYSGPP